MSQTPYSIQFAQALGTSTAFVASGGIAALSAFDIPILRSQPASRSLPSVRWLFSRGSHIFPQMACISSAAFAFLCYSARPIGKNSIKPMIEGIRRGGQPAYYITAAILTLSIAPFTLGVMLPTNFRLIEKNENAGGTTSKARATGVNKINLLDLSDPQSKTKEEFSEEDQDEVDRLLNKFILLNGVRAVLMGLGGLIGLLGALGA